MLQEIRFQVQVLKPCKLVQESSKEVLDLKLDSKYLSRFKKLFQLDARQLLDRQVIYRDL